jgi:DNA mismatch repair ATPase MutS
MVLSAGLGEGNKGIAYVLHLVPLPVHPARRWLRALKEWLQRIYRGERLTQRLRRQPPILQFSLDPRDEAGIRALNELRDRGIGLVANTLAQSTDHVRSFFNGLRIELAFYVGCVNLHEQITRKGEPTCFPVPAGGNDRRLSFRGLFDICLALSMEGRVVGNDVQADKQDLLIVTGANQGGKSTFLRSVGLAQLMMQSGMFVPAEAFSSNLYDGLFTHYSREEDVIMNSGKLDEELARMSDIVDHLTMRSMILFNESFAATNEREGSEIARGIVFALLEKQVRMAFVTHLYEFAGSLRERGKGDVLFLRAERRSDGTRTFRLIEGKPLQTSFGEDLYDRIFEVQRASQSRPAN